MILRNKKLIQRLLLTFFLFVLVLSSNVKAKDHDRISITFKQIKAFTYVDPDVEQVKAKTHKQQVPDDIRALNNKQISIKGFMVPMELDAKGIKSFILVSNQMECCFGLPEQMNGWIICTLKKDERCNYYQDILVDVKGIFEVGEIIDEYDSMSLYRIKVKSVKAPKGSNPITLW